MKNRAEKPKGRFGPASQGWRRHSASVGHCPHPSNHMRRWRELYSKRARGQEPKVVICFQKWLL